MNLLKKFRDAGIPTVSVFISGRALWVNPELNVSGWLHAPLTQIWGDLRNLAHDSEPTQTELRTIQFTPATWRPAVNADIVHFKG